MNILGIIASQGGAAAAVGDFESIATVSVGSGGSASISFTSIPATYQHLQIRAIGRNETFQSGDWPYMRFNNISTNSYSWHRLSSSGAGVDAGAGSTTNLIRYAFVSADSGFGANTFTAVIIDILDYANTNKYKTVRILSGSDNNSASNAYVNLESGLFQSTDAVNRIDLFTYSGDWNQYSHFALYGIKG